MEKLSIEPSALAQFNAMVAQRKFVFRSRNAQVKEVLRKRVKVLTHTSAYVNHENPLARLCRTCGVTGMVDTVGHCHNCDTCNS